MTAGETRSRASPYDPVKRGIDVAAAGVALVALAPVLGALAVAVRMSSPGPVLFRQRRIGLHGAPFTLLKFRTMRAHGDGPLVTSAGDARVTALGSFLRRYKLDELPQLVNILRGDMSIVGPRPEVERYVRMFQDEYEVLLRTRPGLTDYATLEYRHEEQVLARSVDPERAYVEEVLPEKLRLSRKYVLEQSIAVDLTLIGRTLVALVRNHHA